MKSAKELSVDKKILQRLEESAAGNGQYLPLRAARILLQDTEIEAIQNYANIVSIKRLGFNDHGPVHMRTVAYNAIHMLHLLRAAQMQTSIEKEEAGSFEDSMTAVIFAAFLHDLGMTVGRQDHELFSVSLALPIMDRILQELIPEQENQIRRTVIRSLAVEGIAGHMGSRRIHSLEAGIILVADGCDMTKGRARIPISLNTEPKIGDIHKYSANSIEQVQIQKGEQKPIRIEIAMSSDVGYFQIEEVLLQKINCSPVKPYIELLAGVEGKEARQYL